MLQLRAYQRAAVDAISAYWAENPGNGLIVIPTAGGKSLVLAAFVREALEAWPDTRIIILSHVKELLSQDHAELLAHWPEAPVGIYSAGLGLRQINAQILIAGIQSIYKRAYEIQCCDVVIVDEAHLIPRKADTMYRQFLRELAEINPYLKVCGLTATPYRLDSGMLHEGPEALFDAIAHETGVRDLIDQGYLCKLITKQPKTQLDVTGVGTRGGEFIPGQLEAAVDHADTTRAAVREIVSLGTDRKSWLIYGAGINHCRHIAAEIRSHDIHAECVFGETRKDDRADIIARFKSGALRCLVNMNVLTTGFNAPGVDLLAMLRPTKSTGLYVQIVGRGTRVAEGKPDCLVLDFAGNVRRHGPIDAVDPIGGISDGTGDAPVKICPQCQSLVHAASLICPDCGYEFPPREPPILDPTADTAPIISDLRPQWVDVDNISYTRHQKLDKPDSLRVTYYAGLVSFREWVCFEHVGYAREKACQWWIRRAPGMPVPSSVTAALEIAPHVLAKPSQIAVRRNGKYYDIVGAKFG